MNVIRTVLNSLIHFANAEASDPEAEQRDTHIEICTQNLLAMDKAIHTYVKEQGDYPNWLSDLYPKYLSDTNILTCPADEEGGEPILSYNTDPKMPVSYDYQFHPEYREEKSEQRLVYGDVVPLVRCRHHANGDTDCLNLSFASNIYKSAGNWEFSPENLYGSEEEAISALEDALARFPDDERFSDLYGQLRQLYIKTGNEQAAHTTVERLQSLAKLDIEGYRILFSIFDDMERYEELLEIFEKAERQHPDAEPILWRIAYIHRKLGYIELADIYDRKADPKYELIGKPIPEFSEIDLDGDPISIQDYQGKIVLLNFWAGWCGFCAREMPVIQKVYDTYKNEGFDVIGVSLDDEESDLRDTIKTDNLQWRHIYAGSNPNTPLLQQYNINGVPELWLIDREGKLITHKARGDDALEQLVVDALNA